MTYSILLAVNKPEGNNHQHQQEYYNFLRILEDIEKQNKGLQRLTDSCVLLPLNKGLQGVRDVLNSLRSLPYTYTILTEDTKWHEATNQV